MCVCVCVCVCVCMSQWTKVPDEWQARQATPAILQVSSSKHKAKKITTRERGPFHQPITAIFTEEKSVCVRTRVCIRASVLRRHLLHIPLPTSETGGERERERERDRERERERERQEKREKGRERERGIFFWGGGGEKERGWGRKGEGVRLRLQK